MCEEECIENRILTLNDVNEESLQYTIDASQIPPQIGNELPSKEEIQETTNNIFNDEYYCNHHTHNILHCFSKPLVLFHT